MKQSLIMGLRSLELRVADSARSAAFYSDTWGLTPVGEDAGRKLLRARGTEHHVLALSESGTPALVAFELAARDPAAVDTLAGRAAQSGVAVLSAPAELSPQAGGGYGASFATPDGGVVRVSADVSRHPAPTGEGPVPESLTHIVMNTAGMDAMNAFLENFLGFTLSDETQTMQFLRCAGDHHTVALARAEASGLNHAAFLMPDMDALMYGAGRLIDAGFEIEWGVGRHGPGSNVFAYFIDPDGHVVEYTTEMQQVTDGYEAHDAAFWSAFPRRPCRWGVARRPSARLMEAMAGRLRASA